jgi:hypothetical protein
MLWQVIGTLGAGDKQNIVLAIDHHTREIVAQARQSGDKSSEIPVVRELLKDSGLEKAEISIFPLKICANGF